MMLEELMFNPVFENKSESPGLGWLVFISLYKDDLPWLYELGLELYRALESQNLELISLSAKKIRTCVDVCLHGPLGEMFMGQDEMRSMRVFRHLPDMMEHYLLKLEAPGPLRRLKKPPTKEFTAKS
jgi:hypothetical protein